MDFSPQGVFSFAQFELCFEDLSAKVKARNRSGTISDILKCADDASKIVQVKAMPCSMAGWKVGPFSTDHVAWRATEGLPFAKDHHLPIADHHYGLIATKGAHHWWDVASRGLGRYLTIKAGGECIWIARPKANAENGILCPSDYDVLGRTDLFSSDNYDDPKPRNPSWIVEQIYLGPGMTMYAHIACRVSFRA